MHLQVCGAAREVTGSCYLVEAGRSRFLVDCGLHQGGAKENAQNREPFPFDAREIDFVVLTHAHIDHSGLLPKLAKDGFEGPIYATTPTADLADIMLIDSAHIQEMDAEWRGRKAKRAGRTGHEPLYTQKDAAAAVRLFHPVDYDKEMRPSDEVRVVFREAGHILGSAALEIWLDSAAGSVKMVFSGDLGQPDRPIIRDPEVLRDADYLIMESTYGDRLHDEAGDPVEELREIVQQAHRTGGNVIIPAFAVGRTQELIYYLREICETSCHGMQIYVDSPLAIKATEVFRKHRAEFDEEARDMIDANGPIFEFPGLHYTVTADESRALNGKTGAIIISAGGMAEAGRIKHHLKHNLWRPEAHVVIVGYQAHGTLGRRLLEGERRVRLFGDEVAVKATIHDITGLSAHADRAQLIEWASSFKPAPLTILTHGETRAAFALRDALEERLGLEVVVPEPLEIVGLVERPREREARASN
ncbi:MAG: MBL fold metallo-hydrolase [Actinobacteria bacterium]|nr:MBL fold metallo-hydrolase [Actinomycetota bacterium]